VTPTISFHFSRYFSFGKKRQSNAFFRSSQVAMVPLGSALSQSFGRPLRE